MDQPLNLCINDMAEQPQLNQVPQMNQAHPWWPFDTSEQIFENGQPNQHIFNLPNKPQIQQLFKTNQPDQCDLILRIKQTFRTDNLYQQHFVNDNPDSNQQQTVLQRNQNNHFLQDFAKWYNDWKPD